MVRGPVFRHFVVRFLVEHSNKIVFVNDIAAYCTTNGGITIDNKQVAACIANMRRLNESLYDQIEVLVAGKSYRYRETPGVPIGGSPSFYDDLPEPPTVPQPEPFAPSPVLTTPVPPEPQPVPEPEPEPEPEPVPEPAPEPAQMRPSPAAVAAVVKAKRAKATPVRLASADVPRTFTEIGSNDVTREVIVMDDGGALFRLVPIMNQNGS